MNAEQFMEGQKCLIKNELRSSKSEDRFNKKGMTRKKMHGDVFEVIVEDGNIIKRHASQLKGLCGGEVGLCDNKNLSQRHLSGTDKYKDKIGKTIYQKGIYQRVINAEIK